ncbi:hypothetical protein LIER_08664 [Lithospermum erythrorhizon]|uniref:Uncharacterized protein n=1 Tax=Lithospermum erythrorhizon TaxID=34254 RepID=A0AAV3PE65_LITER
MGQEEEALIPPTLQMMPVADNLGLHNPNQEYWTEERILLCFEDWSMVKNSLQNYCENSGVAWTKEWDEVLNLARFDQGNVSTYNYDPNSESGSSSRRRRSSGSVNLWLSASSTFGTPIFFAWFVESGKQGEEQRESTGEESNDIDQVSDGIAPTRQE